MNPLNSIKMHLKGLERSMDGIKTAETRGKATAAIWECVYRIVPQVGAVSLPVEAVSGGGGSVTTVEERGPAESKETASVTIWNGNPVLTPVSDHEVEAVGIIEQLKAQVVTEVATHPSLPVTPVPEVEMIGGWPERAVVTLTGMAPNRRMLKGKIGDGRVVCVERGLGKPTSGEHLCRLVRAGQSPLFRMLTT